MTHFSSYTKQLHVWESVGRCHDAEMILFFQMMMMMEEEEEEGGQPKENEEGGEGEGYLMMKLNIE